jgi:hypothetical protein
MTGTESQPWVRVTWSYKPWADSRPVHLEGSISVVLVLKSRQVGVECRQWIAVVLRTFVNSCEVECGVELHCK